MCVVPWKFCKCSNCKVKTEKNNLTTLRAVPSECCKVQTINCTPQNTGPNNTLPSGVVQPSTPRLFCFGTLPSQWELIICMRFCCKSHDIQNTYYIATCFGLDENTSDFRNNVVRLPTEGRWFIPHNLSQKIMLLV